jgi:hypothetical protein
VSCNGRGIASFWLSNICRFQSSLAVPCSPRDEASPIVSFKHIVNVRRQFFLPVNFFDMRIREMRGSIPGRSDWSVLWSRLVIGPFCGSG